MADTTVNLARQIKNKQVGLIDSAIGVNAEVFYAGQLLEFVEASGEVQGCSDGTANNFAGIVPNNFAGPFTGDGVVKIPFEWGHQVLLVGVATLAVTQENDTDFFAADDQTATATTTLGPKIGVMRKFVSTTSAWFELQRTGTKGS